MLKVLPPIGVAKLPFGFPSMSSGRRIYVQAMHDEGIEFRPVIIALVQAAEDKLFKVRCLDGKRDGLIFLAPYIFDENDHIVFYPGDR